MTLEENFKRLGFYEKREFVYLSQIYHLLRFKLEKPKMQLENGILIISIDIDVGKAELGELNKGKNDANVNFHLSEYDIGKIEETALPLFLQTFNRFGIPVTFAIRGQLTEVNDSILTLLLDSPVRHDLGGHGYFHREFTTLSYDEAEEELLMLSSGLKKLGIFPRSFVFPRNKIAHLDLVGKYGFKCYRSRGGFMKDCMKIERHDGLLDVHPSLYIDKNTKFLFLKKMLDISIAGKLPFHIWFHLWNFGETKESMQKIISKIFVPTFRYVEKMEKTGMLTSETMLSAAEKTRQLS
ncbi:polysaccharide deacetylase family protein [Candidatus Bathyarchaeota archaeon]|nr:polysaccharide deacetylase family protein [Candidatus Bathyarchaeota archaeon]